MAIVSVGDDAREAGLLGTQLPVFQGVCVLPPPSFRAGTNLMFEPESQGGHADMRTNDVVLVEGSSDSFLRQPIGSPIDDDDRGVGAIDSAGDERCQQC